MHSLVTSAPVREVSTGPSESVFTGVLIGHDGQVKVPIRARVGRPQGHVLGVIEWEVDPDVETAVEPAAAGDLFGDPVIESGCHKLQLEAVH